MKISVWKHKFVLVVAQNVYDMEQVIVRYFDNHEMAADFIDKLVIEE